MKHCSFESSIYERWHTVSWATCKEYIMRGDCVLREKFKTTANIL